MRLRPALEDLLPGAEIDAFALQRLRAKDLPFYRGCRLVDLQLQRPGQQQAELTSALVSEFGAALLDGTSPLLHALNPRLIALGDTATAAAYLRFFCAFVRGEEGPFDVIESLESLPFETADQRSAFSAAQQESIGSLRAVGDGRSADGGHCFEACILYSNAVFRANFKVFGSGLVEIADEQPVAGDLPIARRVTVASFAARCAAALAAEWHDSSLP